LRPRIHPQNVECHDCALMVHIPVIEHKHKANCPRCGKELAFFHHANTEYIIAFAITSIAFLFATIAFPFLSFSIQGQTHDMTLLEGLKTLIDNHFLILAALQVFAIFLVPLIILSSLLYLLIPLQFNKPILPAKGSVFKLIFRLVPWSMAEIFLIGTLVSLIKLSSMADITLGLSFYSYILFSVFLIFTLSLVDKTTLRQQLDIIDQPTKPSKYRNPQTTWALLFTAILVYIPASIYPIMTTQVLGRESPSTIMEGVILMWQHGSYPIAIIIFIASVFIPIAKIIALSWLNYTLHIKSNSRNKQRMLLYRITEFVGRWSMIDVFVVVILVSLVQIGSSMSVLPGPGVLAFCALVIITMLAAMSFDSHQIWQTENNNDRSTD
jgi:paraquat-inducible protein A